MAAAVQEHLLYRQAYYGLQDDGTVIVAYEHPCLAVGRTGILAWLHDFESLKLCRNQLTSLGRVVSVVQVHLSLGKAKEALEYAISDVRDFRLPLKIKITEEEGSWIVEIDDPLSTSDAFRRFRFGASRQELTSLLRGGSIQGNPSI